jgi:hypothetical protein
MPWNSLEFTRFLTFLSFFTIEVLFSDTFLARQIQIFVEFVLVNLDNYIVLMFNVPENICTGNVHWLTP